MGDEGVGLYKFSSDKFFSSFCPFCLFQPHKHQYTHLEIRHGGVSGSLSFCPFVLLSFSGLCVYFFFFFSFFFYFILLYTKGQKDKRTKERPHGQASRLPLFSSYMRGMGLKRTKRTKGQKKVMLNKKPQTLDIILAMTFIRIIPLTAFDAAAGGGALRRGAASITDFPLLDQPIVVDLRESRMV